MKDDWVEFGGQLAHEVMGESSSGDYDELSHTSIIK